MPTVLNIMGFRFFFFSNEGHEAPHIHVAKGDAYGKWWIGPIAEVYSIGFSPAEARTIRRLLFENEGLILEAWRDYFDTDR